MRYRDDRLRSLINPATRQLGRPGACDTRVMSRPMVAVGRVGVEVRRSFNAAQRAGVFSSNSGLGVLALALPGAYRSDGQFLRPRGCRRRHAGRGLLRPRQAAALSLLGYELRGSTEHITSAPASDSGCCGSPAALNAALASSSYRPRRRWGVRIEAIRGQSARVKELPAVRCLRKALGKNGEPWRSSGTSSSREGG